MLRRHPFLAYLIAGAALVWSTTTDAQTILLKRIDFGRVGVNWSTGGWILVDGGNIYSFTGLLADNEVDETSVQTTFSKSVSSPTPTTTLTASGVGVADVTHDINTTLNEADGRSESSSTVYYDNAMGNYFELSGGFNGVAEAKYTPNSPTSGVGLSIHGRIQVKVDGANSWPSSQSHSASLEGPGINTFRCSSAMGYYTYYLDCWENATADGRVIQFRDEPQFGHDWDSFQRITIENWSHQDVIFHPIARSSVGIGEPAGTHVGSNSGTAVALAKFKNWCTVLP